LGLPLVRHGTGVGLGQAAIWGVDETFFLCAKQIQMTAAIIEKSRPERSEHMSPDGPTDQTMKLFSLYYYSTNARALLRVNIYCKHKKKANQSHG
jgi:hypothetical protein